MDQPTQPTHQKNSTWDAFMWGSKLQLPNLVTTEAPPIPTHRRGASMPPNLEDDNGHLPSIQLDELLGGRPRLGHRSRPTFSLGGETDWNDGDKTQDFLNGSKLSPSHGAKLPPGMMANAAFGKLDPDEILVAEPILQPHHRRGGSNPPISTLGSLDLGEVFPSTIGMGGAKPSHRRSVTFQGMTSNNNFQFDGMKQALSEQKSSNSGQPSSQASSTTPPPSNSPPLPFQSHQQQQQQQQNHQTQQQQQQPFQFPQQPQQIPLPSPPAFFPSSNGDFDFTQDRQMMFQNSPLLMPTDPNVQLQLQMQQALIVQQQQWLLAMQQQQQQQLQHSIGAQQRRGSPGISPAITPPMMIPQFYQPPTSTNTSGNISPPMMNRYPAKPMQQQQASSMSHQNQSSSLSSNDPVLAEYKATGQRPRIEDLKGHVFAFASDAHGSRFLQYQMEIARPEDKEALVMESLSHAVNLMQDTFGNYVIQNFLEHATPSSRRALAERMQGSMLQLSIQTHGCRVVQRALDLVDIDQRNELLKELLVPRGNVFQAARNTHATHVLQKTVSILRRDSALEEKGDERVKGSIELMRAMEKAVADDVVALLLHPHAYRLVLNVLGDCDSNRSPHVARAVQIIAENRDTLCVDQHGNFMLQHMLDNKEGDGVLDFVFDRLVELSQHKFGSHLVEKCFAVASAARCSSLVEELLRPTTESNIAAAKKIRALGSVDWEGAESPTLALMMDPYANFVVQKAFDRIPPGNLKTELINLVQDNADLLGRFTYGRHILAHVTASRQQQVPMNGAVQIPTHQNHQSPPRGQQSHYPRGGGRGGNYRG